METTEITTEIAKVIRHYIVAAKDGPARYMFEREVAVGGRDPETIIKGWIDEVCTYGFPKPDQSQRVLRPTSDPLSDNLDIDLGIETGTITIVIQLPPDDTTKSKLSFVDDKFIELPSNFKGGRKFVVVDRNQDPSGKWLKLTIDLEVLRNSALAREIKAILKDDDGHVPVMAIPFTLNITDTGLGFSPWMLPVDPETLPHLTFTHGGVHPNASYNFYVSLA
ncbi:hypothetical protein [Novosphingobium beihaiensis]|uniref:Uncharacterized protein n=1 Tax=Novosphingobium beihaiensis TaxID=2930389 RepID=A0ABT0BSI9_9SPHN|nr:hypothetical protein [Novosphingobium beihaiensis]MCJ2188037.1 hypothetical protein [Novosphingobium beihaiensis]